MSILANDHMGGNVDEMIDGKYKPSDLSHPLVKLPKSVMNFLIMNLDYFFLFYGPWGINSEYYIVTTEVSHALCAHGHENERIPSNAMG